MSRTLQILPPSKKRSRRAASRLSNLRNGSHRAREVSLARRTDAVTPSKSVLRPDTCSTMFDHVTRLPCRRPELVLPPSGPSGSCLVRNGESFAVGPEEHFLLERLDGSRTADQLCAAFADIPESA